MSTIKTLAHLGKTQRKCSSPIVLAWCSPIYSKDMSMLQSVTVEQYPSVGGRSKNLRGILGKLTMTPKDHNE